MILKYFKDLETIDSNLQNNFFIHPNQDITNQQIELDLPLKGLISVKIFSRYGSLIYSTQFSKPGIHSIKPKLETGIYELIIANPFGQFIRKVNMVVSK